MTNKIDEKLANSLGIESVIIQKIEKPQITSIITKVPEGEHSIVAENPHAANDFDVVRKNLKELIEVGKTALDGIMQVATEGESPRAYEVVAIIMRQIADANTNLIDLHKKVKDISRTTAHERKQTASSITNNAIYLGSTKDLQEFLRVQKETQNKKLLEQSLEQYTEE